MRKVELIPDNFEVHCDATRIHHPTDENAQQRYRAIHYTVSLNSQRAALPEFAMFGGMRCEIQIQTILNHAWAETSHDILYKPPAITGFGSKAMQSIEDRMVRIMDDYLLPAGYEFQKVQHDFDRLMQGKILLDRDALNALATTLPQLVRRPREGKQRDHRQRTNHDGPAWDRHHGGRNLRVAARKADLARA